MVGVVRVYVRLVVCVAVACMKIVSNQANVGLAAG